MFEFMRDFIPRDDIEEIPNNVKHKIQYVFWFCCFSWSHTIEIDVYDPNLQQGRSSVYDHVLAAF